MRKDIGIGLISNKRRRTQLSRMLLATVSGSVSWHDVKVFHKSLLMPSFSGYQEEMFREIWPDGSSSLTKIIFFRAMRKKYHSEKLEAMARRKAAVERYQSPTSEPDQ